jgi:protoporphyrin/coproporphyrin ferrochelatase
MSGYDALLVVSFGGPEGPEDVMPFLDNVLRGRPVSDERKREVAGHYLRFGGRSPINDQCRALVAAIEGELRAHGPRLPVYWGNRNWHPLLADTLRQMADDGVKHALAFMTSAFSSYSGCRQYRENVQSARAEVGARAPEVSKLRVFFNHPGFVEPMARSVREALAQIPAERRDKAPLVFTAHSIPLAMARGCDYEAQLREASRLIAAAAGRREFRLAFQSRSGNPSQPWLEPDILEELRAIRAEGMEDVVVAPVGFISDHMEVVYDLDTEAAAKARDLSLGMVRAATVGTAPEFVAMIRELVLERVEGAPRRALGSLGPRADACADDCCLPSIERRAGAARTTSTARRT